jgi:hypothetical protein
LKRRIRESSTHSGEDSTKGDQLQSQAAKGWVVFDDTEGETLVALNEWKLRFEKWSHEK